MSDLISVYVNADLEVVHGKTVGQLSQLVDHHRDAVVARVVEGSQLRQQLVQVEGAQPHQE